MVADGSAAFLIGTRPIGPTHPCLIIAEVGVNHNGSVDMALMLIDAAAEAGADAVKFQAFRPDRLVLPSAPKAEYQTHKSDRSESQFDMLKRLQLEDDAYITLRNRCTERGVIFLCTPFDEQSADLLDEIGVAAFKVGSGDVTNHFLLRHIARKMRPVLLSTGMASLQEVSEAVRIIAAKAIPFALLQCVSNYPADPADVNLLAIKTMHDAFGCVVGYSDHTLGNEVAFAAVALGAHVIEKHFTLDRSLPGPDHLASSEPSGFAALVAGVRTVEKALGNGLKARAPSEAATALVARRSLVSAALIPAGTRIDETMVVARRPGGGMAPNQLSTILGRRCVVHIPAGTLLEPEMFE